jgi:methylenetetrahydrofolate reductase (NADPH)
MVLSPTTTADISPISNGQQRRIDNSLTRVQVPTISFEYFPPKTDAGTDLLLGKLHSMRNMNPMWIDVTFGAGGSTSQRTLAICEFAANKLGINVMMHLTCTNMTVNDLDRILEQMKEAGLRNIMALRGDPPRDAVEWKPCEGGFRYAVDLVRYIRSKYGDYFCIGVAGYPEGHTDCESLDADLNYLKAKVDAGADMIVTQLFYDTSLFLEFVERARKIGISCPIVPGIMPITTYNGFMRMTDMCKTFVPDSIREQVERVKEDDTKVRELGIEIATDMCKQLIESGKIYSVHLYTMNNEDNIREIVRRLADHLPEAHKQWMY